MQKGDLSVTPLSAVLDTLAASEASGCLHVDDGTDEALVYLKGGLVYSIFVPGRRPQLGARLVSSGALLPEALEEALEAQLTELQGWRLGELLVHLGYVDRSVVEGFSLEQLREGFYDLTRWGEGTWRFRKSEKTREDLGASATVQDLLDETRKRDDAWAGVLPVIHGRHGVPELSSAGMSSAELTLDQDQWALFCKVDGRRAVAELARDCGFTDFEAGQIVYGLVEAGLVEMAALAEGEEDEEIEAPRGMGGELGALGASLAARLGGALGGSTATAVEAPPFDDWDVGDLPEASESELSRLLSASAATASAAAAAAEPEPEPEPVAPTSSEDLTSALSALLDDLNDDATTDEEAAAVVIDSPEEAAERAHVIRDGAAAELAEMVAQAQAERQHEPETPADDSPAISVVDISIPDIEVPALAGAPGRGPSIAELAAAELAADKAEPAADYEAPAAVPAAEVATAAVEEPAADLEAGLAAFEQAFEHAASAAGRRRSTPDTPELPEAAIAEGALPPPPPPAAAELLPPPPPSVEPAEPAEPAAAAWAPDPAAFFAPPPPAEAAATFAQVASEPLAPPPPPPVGEPSPVTVTSFDPPPPAPTPEFRMPQFTAEEQSPTGGFTDTASLLRELSSLGLEDEPPKEAPRPPAPPRPAGQRPPTPPSRDAGKKKKGLFGR